MQRAPARPADSSFSNLTVAWWCSGVVGGVLCLCQATWDPKNGRVGELATVFNPHSKGAPLYWHARDFLIIMSIEDYRNPNTRQRLTVVR